MTATLMANSEGQTILCCSIEALEELQVSTQHVLINIHVL